MPGITAGIVNYFLRADDSQFRREVKRSRAEIREQERAFRILQSRVRRADAAIGRYAKRLVSLRSITALAAGAGGVGLLIRRTATLGATLVETGQRLGLAVEELQTLQRAFAANGVAHEQTTTALERFSQAIGEAKDGALEYREAFERLGISLFDARGNLRGTRDLLGEVADQLRELPDAAIRVQTARELFGRPGAALIPTLLGGDEEIRRTQRASAAEIGVVTAEQASRLKDLEQSFEDLKDALGVVSAELVSGLVPSLETLNESLARFARDSLPAIRATIAAISEMGTSLKIFAGIIAGAVLTGGIARIGKSILDLASAVSAAKNSGTILRAVGGGLGALRLGLTRLLPGIGIVSLLVELLVRLRRQAEDATTAANVEALTDTQLYQRREQQIEAVAKATERVTLRERQVARLRAKDARQGFIDAAESERLKARAVQLDREGELRATKREIANRRLIRGTAEVAARQEREAAAALRREQQSELIAERRAEWTSLLARAQEQARSGLADSLDLQREQYRLQLRAAAAAGGALGGATGVLRDELREAAAAERALTDDIDRRVRMTSQQIREPGYERRAQALVDERRAETVLQYEQRIAQARSDGELQLARDLFRRQQEARVADLSEEQRLLVESYRERYELERTIQLSQQAADLKRRRAAEAITKQLEEQEERERRLQRQRDRAAERTSRILTSGLEAALLQSESLRQVLVRTGQELLRVILRAAVLDRLGRYITSAVTGALGRIGGTRPAAGNQQPLRPLRGARDVIPIFDESALRPTGAAPLTISQSFSIQSTDGPGVRAALATVAPTLVEATRAAARSDTRRDASRPSPLRSSLL